MDELLIKDVTIAVNALNAKKPIYDRLWDYYDGNHELMYSSGKLKEAFNGLNANFSLNWCEVVVNAVHERMELVQFVATGDKQKTRALNDWWEESEMDLDADDVELCALVTGEAFVIVWPEEDGVLGAYYNDSRLCHVFYEDDRPKQMRFAAKWWQAGSDLVRLTLYYPDKLFYFAAKTKKGGVLDGKSFKPLPDVVKGADVYEVANPLQRVPVFRFQRERRAVKSELGPSTLNTQDAINKLLADMMVAAEFGALKQRYTISQVDTSTLRGGPGTVISLAAGDGQGQDTSVGEFQETPLQNFLSPITSLSTALSKTTRTPQYYFFLGARADPSGESLYAMDGPLIKKTNLYIKRFTRQWKLLIRFVAEQMGIDIANGLEVQYADPRTIQPFTQSQTRVQNTNAGIPLETQLKREGWSQMELDQMRADKAAEKEAAQESLAVAMLNSQRRFDGE